MKNLEKCHSHYDVLIIGGGIVGCGILRDLALNLAENESNARVLLVEKGDFCSQTSQGSSKMLHGGIRYLENFDFSLISEALHEKNLWLKLTPHLCYEEKFFLPVYGSSKYPLPFIKIGLMMYDMLSGFKNTKHSAMFKGETLKTFPEMEPKHLRGAGIYYDGIVEDAKLGLECLYDALEEKQATALNYVEVLECEKKNSHYRVLLHDRITDKKKEITTTQVIFATGPFTDGLMKKLKLQWEPQLVPSKGIHLWLKKEDITLPHPVVLQTEDNRVIFVIPERDAILAGTTETLVDEEIFDIKANETEINYLLAEVKRYFPNSKLGHNSIIDSIAAVRPLVKDSHSSKPGKVSRHHKIFQPYKNLFIIMGGKYTTFRVMAQQITKTIMNNLGLSYHYQLTLNSLRSPSKQLPFSKQNIDANMIKDIIKNEHVRTIDDLWQRRLSQISKNHPTINLNFQEIEKIFKNGN
ncbi:MAG: glycerol-3-phosphate dehydrogenase/oxidase [Bacteriovoracaceae bacterium]|nr:glycerol-3-phosphate dehydrogenase/oxidase [Bacteriovoracaceae bacterium]